MLCRLEVNLFEYKEVLISYRTVFQKAKHEVFVLIRDDNYARWRKTMAFSSFFREILMYNTEERSVF